MRALTINKLNKTYANGTTALINVDLEIESGDFFALLGANGAGKTTIIGIITGIVNKTSGEIFVLDYNLDNKDEAKKAKKLIGIVPQELNFNVFEKVQDIVITQAGYFGIKRNIAMAESEIILKRLGLWEKRNVQSRTLSGGMKRRLMIARALIHKPEILILDEPTAGVDVELRHNMWDYLREINSTGTTILLTTHYLEEAELMCRNAAIIKDGKIVRHDKVSNLLQMLDKTTYIITLDNMVSMNKIKHFNPVIVDRNNFEVEIDKDNSFNEFINILSKLDIQIINIRPKENPLEKLFLNILNDSGVKKDEL